MCYQIKQTKKNQRKTLQRKAHSPDYFLMRNHKAEAQQKLGMTYLLVFQIPYLTCLILGNRTSIKFTVHVKFEALGL